jgi:hypothetical protein
MKLQDGLSLYHGTNERFAIIDLSKSRNKRDFGRGFYTTTIKTQAADWARSLVARRDYGKPYVMEFTLQLSDSLNCLRVLNFDSLSREWLEFVKNNRMLGGCIHDYDIVLGPVANDNTMPTIIRYINGEYTAAEAIERLRYMDVSDQVSFHTEKALRCLELEAVSLCV